MCEKYNGWTNYETWCVHLWLTNNEFTYDLCIELAQELDNKDLERALKDLVEEDAPDISGTLFADLLNGALSAVNWYEIAEAFQETVRDNERQEQ